MAGRMTKIKLDEISLVDYPAHTINGFAVVKSASDSDSNDIMDALGKRNTNPMATDQIDLTKALGDASAEDITKALEARLADEDFAKAFPFKKPADAKDAKASDSDEDDVMKSLPEPVREMLKARDEKIQKAEQRAADAETTANIEKSLRLDREATELAKSEYQNLAFNYEKFGPAFRKFAESDADAAKTISEVLKAVNAQADGAIFKELGTSASTEASGEPQAQIETIAKALVAEGKAKDLSDGISKAVADPANKSLVDAYFKG